jgi:hypothetical protein
MAPRRQQLHSLGLRLDASAATARESRLPVTGQAICYIA